MRRWAKVLPLAFVFVLVVSVVALAQEGETPWEGLEITIGGVVLAWAGVVAAVVEIGKHVYFGDEPLLNTSAKIWGANLALGGLGIFIYEVMGGASVLEGLLAALTAIIAASGVFEGVKTVTGNSKKSSEANESSPTGT